MCTTKKAATVSAPTVTDKDLPILRNPYVDGLNAYSRGTSSLRIDRAPSGTTRISPVTAPVVALPTPARPATPDISTGDTTQDAELEAIRRRAGLTSDARLTISRSIQ